MQKEPMPPTVLQILNPSEPPGETELRRFQAELAQSRLGAAYLNPAQKLALYRQLMQELSQQDKK